MGSIKRFDLKRISKDYKTPFFFETGTFIGDGVAYAMQTPFERILSVEIIPSIATAAKERFSSAKEVKIIEGKSTAILEQELPLVPSNCVFWLDAHFPGADAGLTTYDSGEEEEEERLPLLKELTIIKKLRVQFQDVVIIDDMRIYEDGPYENGNVPADALPRFNRTLDFVYQLFEKTHFILKSYLDEGYVILLPIPWYKKIGYRLFSTYGRSPSLEVYIIHEHKLNGDHHRHPYK